MSSSRQADCSKLYQQFSGNQYIFNNNYENPIIYQDIKNEELHRKNIFAVIAEIIDIDLLYIASFADQIQYIDVKIVDGFIVNDIEIIDF